MLLDQFYSLDEPSTCAFNRYDRSKDESGKLDGTVLAEIKPDNV